MKDAVDVTMITNQSAIRMIDWCEGNISESTYMFPHLSGIKVGCDKWEIYAYGSHANAYIEDEALQAFFMLAFVKD